MSPAATNGEDWNVDRSHRLPVSYIDKSRAFYAAHGYDVPYRWATNRDAPFTAPTKPLSASRVGIVTTASLHIESTEDQPTRKKAYAHPTSPHPQRLYTDDLSWDKDATHTNDLETYLPLATLEALAAEGRIDSVSSRFYGVPTAYSHRRSMADGERIEEWCREDGVDLVLLIPL